MLNVYRSSVLGIAGFPPVERFIRRYGERLGARRFVAGRDVPQALPVLHGLESEGRLLLLDVLGEYVHDIEQARAMERSVAAAIAALHAAGITPVISVKPTQLGLAIAPDLAFEAADRLAAHAERLGGRMALDMEDARFTDDTLELLFALWRAGRQGASGVLQSHLHRTPADLERMLATAPDVRQLEVRIVKGAYAERRAIAYQDTPSIRRAFIALVERVWEAGARANVATHDERLISAATAYARGARIGPERIELQFIYGVKPRLQARLAREGRRVRIYVPVGTDWYGYYSRRLAERPANLAVVLRGLLG